MYYGECTALDTVLDASWHRIDPAGETRCAHDTDYTFWVRPGNNDILLYFQGGGGCWDQSSCRIGSSFYKQHVSPLEPRTYRNGIFDFNNPDPTFAQFNYQFDNVQQRYFAIGQADPRQFVGENLPIVLQDIADSTTNFRYYIEEGDSHCILPSADLYRAEVNGVPALDWITSIALGEPVDNLP